MRTLLTALLSCMLLASPAQAGTQKAPAAEAEVQVQSIAPEALTALLNEAPGKVRVVNFWATWCGPCVAELPLLRTFAEANDDVEVLLVNVDLPSLRDRKVIPFLKRFEIQGLRNLQLDDPDPAMALLRAVPDWPDAIPVTQVYRADGRRALVLNRGLKEGELEKAVEAARSAEAGPPHAER